VKVRANRMRQGMKGEGKEKGGKREQENPTKFLREKIDASSHMY